MLYEIILKAESTPERKDVPIRLRSTPQSNRPTRTPPRRQFLGLTQTCRLFRQEFSSLYWNSYIAMVPLDQLSRYLRDFPLRNSALWTQMNELLAAVQPCTPWPPGINVKPILMLDGSQLPFEATPSATHRDQSNKCWNMLADIIMSTTPARLRPSLEIVESISLQESSCDDRVTMTVSLSHATNSSHDPIPKRLAFSHFIAMSRLYRKRKQLHILCESGEHTFDFDDRYTRTGWWA